MSRRMGRTGALLSVGIGVLLGVGSCSPSEERRTFVGSVDAEVVASIGGENTFASIGDVLVTRNGIYVVDSRGNRVHGFTPRGDVMPELPRDGQGPGEVLFPRAVDVAPSGEVMVLDPGNGGVSLFDEAENGLVFSRRESFDINSDDFCTMGSSVFVAGRSSAGVVHKLDQDFQVEASVDVLSSYEDERLETEARRGRLVCDAIGGRVIFVPNRLGTLLIWEIPGGRLYELEIPGRLDERTDPDRGLHYGGTPLLDPGGRLIIPLGYKKGSVLELELIAESAEGELEWWRGPAIDAHLQAIEGETWIAAELETVPRLKRVVVTWRPD